MRGLTSVLVPNAFLTRGLFAGGIGRHSELTPLPPTMRRRTCRALLFGCSGFTMGRLYQAPAYFPMQKVEKMRFRISSAVVAPVIASMGRSAA